MSVNGPWSGFPPRPFRGVGSESGSSIAGLGFGAQVSERITRVCVRRRRLADFAAFRLSNLKYVYDPHLDTTIAFPRLRALRTADRPNGLVIFDVINK